MALSGVSRETCQRRRSEPEERTQIGGWNLVVEVGATLVVNEWMDGSGSVAWSQERS